MLAVIVENAKHVIRGDRARRLRGYAADPETLKRRLPFARRNDNPVGIAEDRLPRLPLLILDDSPVLLLEPIRRTLVIVVEKRNKRSPSLRQHRVSHLRDPAVFALSNETNLVMRPPDFLDDRGGTVRRAVVDDDDLARRPRLRQRAFHGTPDGVLRLVACDPDRDERPDGGSSAAHGYHPLPLCSPTANRCSARFAPTLLKASMRTPAPGTALRSSPADLTVIRS